VRDEPSLEDVPLKSAVAGPIDTIMQTRLPLCPVRIDGLVPDSVLGFDLYLQSAPGSYLLWHAAGGEFESGQRQRLAERGVTALWVTPEQERAYEAYVERHLASLMTGRGSADGGAALLYSAAHTTLSAVLSDPRHQDAVPKTRELAQEMVGLIMRDADALAQLTGLMAADYDTVRHCINVSLFATALAHASGVRNPGELQDLAHGTLLHDIGKSRVPRELIVKPGAYSPGELAIMRTHVDSGERILRADGRLAALGMYAVSQHHERMDGEGYPRRLPAADLHVFGRVSAICDVYDALTSERTYKRALSGFDALRLMRTEMASQFDQELLHTFIKVLGPRTQVSPSLASVA
jgi:putative nucleotidyltransferase with HDIG domain